MIITRCPLRVSLVGGSTDLQKFLDKYENGSVISFPVNLYTYIMMDFSKDNDYVVHYSKYERVKNPNNIKNDIAREVIKWFNLKPVTISFNTDIPATGSGLGSSTSYLIAMIKASHMLLDEEYSQFEICEEAIKIERKFNKHTGYQDAYGCGLPGLKRINFNKNGKISIIPLIEVMSRNADMLLIDTEIRRKSDNILSTINIDKAKELLPIVNSFESRLTDVRSLGNLLRYNWNIKTETSPEILTDNIKNINDVLKKTIGVFGYKLLGAGGGGYYFVLSLLNNENILTDIKKIKIKIDNIGVTGWKI